MRMSQAFPSKYLKAGDLQNRRFTLTMDSVRMESVAEHEPDKPVLYFKGAEKGMVLNQTNGMMIASLYGDDTDTWGGRQIELYTAVVPFNGKNVPAIRVMAPAGNPAPLSAPMPASPAPHSPLPTDAQGGGGYVPDLGPDLDDEIPF